MACYTRQASKLPPAIMAQKSLPPGPRTAARKGVTRCMPGMLAARSGTRPARPAVRPVSCSAGCRVPRAALRRVMGCGSGAVRWQYDPPRRTQTLAAMVLLARQSFEFII